jgi:hypothetical protein
MKRKHLLQLVWVGLAIIFLAAAGLMQATVDQTGEDLDLNPPEKVVAENQPGLAFLNVMPGGLRAPVVNYLWIRANDLKEQGRYYDAYQLASLICHLQPRSPGVWYFHGWNMAWNITAAVHTPQQRWHWVSNGLRLLRDQAIPMNPESIYLYKELAWIFMNKIGGHVDEFHWHYKRRWAAKMHEIFGAAPTAATTEEAIERFRRIAEAPLDSDPRRPRQSGAYQTDVLEEQILEVDPAAAEYAARLAEAEIGIDRSLLQAWHAWSQDRRVVDGQPLVGRPEPTTALEQTQAELINSSQYAQAREKLLDWVRAQVLWNDYQMDPDYMLHLMETYNVPLDWRLPWPHGMYWVSLGFKRCDVPDVSAVTPLNTNRILLSCLKEMTAYGRLGYEANYENPDEPTLYPQPDPRYIDPTHKQYVALSKEYQEDLRKAEGTEIPLRRTQFASGHVNFLREAMMMMVIAGREQEANGYLRWIKDNYGFEEDPKWQVDTAAEHLLLRYEKDPFLTPKQARQTVGIALARALANLAGDNREGYSRIFSQYILPIYRSYNEEMPDRNKLEPLQELLAQAAGRMLVNPRSYGYNFSLQARSTLWRNLSGLSVPVPQQGQPVRFSVASVVYDGVRPMLARQCEGWNRDFDKLFPAPPDLAAWRQFRAQRRPTVE